MKLAIIPYWLDSMWINKKPYCYLFKAWESIIMDENTILKDDSYVILCYKQVDLIDTLRNKTKKILQQNPRNKKVLVMSEPPVVEPNMHRNKNVHKWFDIILTRNNKLWDNKKYFPYYVPFTKWKINKDKTFQEKKFLTLINWNKWSFVPNELYSRREKAIRYYEKNNKDFDLYWIRRNIPNFKQRVFWYKPYPSYKWSIDDKIEVLSNYKFNICFENMHNIDWYVTEKIRDSFQAKSIPVYRWANNITDYIPGKCFIDFRKFDKDFDKLTNYLENISEDEYNTYINQINKFMANHYYEERCDDGWAEHLTSNLHKILVNKNWIN